MRMCSSPCRQAADTVAGKLAADPTRSFSRLLCPRRLEERRAYTLFLVPAYEAGRLRGIGKEPRRNRSMRLPGRTASTDPVDLPVYYQSRFVTDSLEDLETQLRRLKPMTIAGDQRPPAPPSALPPPGQAITRATRIPARSFEVQGALRQSEDRRSRA